LGTATPSSSDAKRVRVAGLWRDVGEAAARVAAAEGEAAAARFATAVAQGLAAEDDSVLWPLAAGRAGTGPG
jgi:hypothetical protein